MEVGLVVPGDIERTSGGYRYDRRLVEELEARGDDVDVLEIPHRSTSGAERSTHDPSIRNRLDRPYDLLLQDELCHPTLVEHNPGLERPTTVVSIVHLLQATDPAVADPSVRRRERRYLESVDGAVCTSAYTRGRTTDLASVPTVVAPPAGRHEGPAVSADAVESRARSNPFRVAFVGNVVPRKNVTTLLEALARVDGSTHDWRLTVVGSQDDDPAYASRVRDRVAALGLDERVTLAGEVEDGRLESILERSHVLAVPSSYEGFGMVYLEAMEYGVVPIAGSVGGASEVVADGRNGIVVDPTDATRLADEIRDLAADRDRLARLGTGGLETADAHPTWAETTTAVRSFLRRRLEDAEPGWRDGGDGGLP